MKTDLFQSYGHCWVFQISWHIEYSSLRALSFRIWNNSTGIPDILGCEVKRALGSITMNKASGGDGIPVELESNPKRWCCESAALSMPANWKTALATWLEKVCFHSNPKERQWQRLFKLLHNLHSFHTLAKKCSRFSKPDFNSTWTMNFQLFKLDLEKAEEPEIKLPTSDGS